MSQSRENNKSEIKWTRQQSRAIEEHGRNVFVCASAGTGKTAVLSGSCADVISNLSVCPDVWSLLVVTFTEMAAEEMRARIAKQLRIVMETTKDARLANHLRHQLILLGAADISTIHSFCKRIITEHFYETGLDPTFGIIDADEAKLLKSEILEKTIDWAWKQNDIADGLRLLLTRRDLRMTDGFPAVIIEISGFLDGMVSRQKWLERAKLFAQASDIYATDLAGEQKKIIIEKLEEAKSKLEFAVQIYKSENTGGDWPAKYGYGYINTVEKCIENFKAGRWEFDRPKASTPKDGSKGKFIYEIVKDALDSVKELENCAILNPEYLRKFTGMTGTQTKVLIELVRHFDEAYGQAKKAINCLDFSDLEHYALKLLMTENLEPTQTALKLRKKYKYIFVDEYQDINDVQQAIINMVGSSDNVFAVGDPKQSIYHWRGARPEIFMQHLGKAGTEPKSESEGLRVDLNINFRSEKPILDFANKVFGRIMTASFSGIDYDESAYLKPYKQEKFGSEPAVELHILDEAKNIINTEPITNRQLEAAVIAQRIKELTGPESSERIIDKETENTRPVEYRDIVILMRSIAGKSDFVEALRQAGIPVSCDAVSGYFEATEITDMLSLLKVLDNPRRDIEFAAVLRSPFFNLSDSELVRIRLSCKTEKLSFYDSVKTISNSEGELSKKLAETLDVLEKWRTAARRGSLSELIWNIFRQTGFLSFVCALPDGQARRANLLKLHDRAIQFEGFAGNSGIPSLRRFIEFIEKLRAAGEDWSKPQPEAGTGNTVRIMSIHKSKGLEFPIVFVADLDNDFSGKDFTKECITDEELTIGLKVIDTESNSRLDSLAYQVIENRRRKKIFAEEMRILYVAMTRARNKLLLVGCKEGQSAANVLTAANWFGDGAIPSWYLQSYKNHLDWILSALAGETILHQVFETSLSPNNPKNNLFSVKYYKKEDLEKISGILHKPETQKNDNHQTQIANFESLLKLKESLNWQYPFGEAPLLPAKRTVTQWTHRNDEFARIDYSRAFERKPKVISISKQADGREIGTAVHLVLSKLDLGKPITEEAVSGLIKKFVKDEAVIESAAMQIDIESILKFFKSEIGQTILNKSNRVEREWPFTLAVPASQWENEIEGLTDLAGKMPATREDFVIVQGIIDLIIKTPQGLMILDFKTDDVTQDEIPKRAQMYKKQLELYGQAAASITGQKVISKCLYFLRAGLQIEI